MYSPDYFKMQVMSKPSTPLRSHTKPALAKKVYVGDDGSPYSPADRTNMTKLTVEAVGEHHHRQQYTPGSPAPKLSSPFTSPKATASPAAQQDKLALSISGTYQVSEGGDSSQTMDYQLPKHIQRQEATASPAAANKPAPHHHDATGATADFDDIYSEEDLKQVASLGDLVGAAAKTRNKRLLHRDHKQLYHLDSTAAEIYKDHKEAGGQDAPTSPYSQQYIKEYFDARRKESQTSATQSRASQFYNRLRLASEREQQFAIRRTPTIDGQIIAVKQSSQTTPHRNTMDRTAGYIEGDEDDVAAFGAARDRVSTEQSVATERLKHANSGLIDQLAVVLKEQHRTYTFDGEDPMSPNALRKRRSMHRAASMLSRSDTLGESVLGSSVGSPRSPRSPSSGRLKEKPMSSAGMDFMSAVGASAMGDGSMLSRQSTAAASRILSAKDGGGAKVAKAAPKPERVQTKAMPAGQYYSFPLTLEERQVILNCLAYCSDTGFIPNASDFRFQVGWHRGDVMRIAQLLTKNIDSWQCFDYGTVEWNVVHNCLTAMRKTSKWPSHGVMPPLVDPSAHSLAKEQPGVRTVSRRTVDLLHTDLLNDFAKAASRFEHGK